MLVSLFTVYVFADIPDVIAVPTNAVISSVAGFPTIAEVLLLQKSLLWLATLLLVLLLTFVAAMPTVAVFFSHFRCSCFCWRPCC